MYIFSNSLKNLLRNKGRNLLLSAIILAIVVTTVIALAITRTAEGIIEDYRQRFGSQVIISVDFEAFSEHLSGRTLEPGVPIPLPQISAQQSLAFSRLEYIRDYSIIARHGASNLELIAVDVYVGESPLLQTIDGHPIPEVPDGVIIPHFHVIGGGWDDEFINGQRQISEGRMPQIDNEALVSIEIAELNNLSVGDEIRLYSNLFSGEDAVSTEIRTIYRDITIVGIYFDMTRNPFEGFIRTPVVNRRNEILTTLNSVLTQLGDDDSGIGVEATFYLHNPSYLAAFERSARNLGLDEMLLISTNEADYNAIIAPIDSMRRVAQSFMLVVLVLGGIVLMILSSIAIRERKYEIGVLRAMGMKKHKVAAGLWVEMLAITFICLVVGLTIGSGVAQPVSDALLAHQLENSNTFSETSIGGNALQFGGREMFNISDRRAGYSQLDTLDVSLSVRAITQVIAISLLLSSLATLAAIVKITKYEPIKILMERN